MLNLKNEGIKKFYDQAKKRTLYVFGASKRIYSHTTIMPSYSLFHVANYIVDNDEKKWGKLYGDKLPIISPSQMVLRIKKDDIILIMPVCYENIIKQLDNITELDGIDCYIIDYIHDYLDSFVDMDYYEKSKENKYCIPPVLHYCWFGNNNLPLEYKRYIESWKKFCPDYKIIRWDESNYDVTKHTFLKKAYKEKKWAFVSDYARLDIVYNNGGIYLDTDVEVIKNFDELRKFHAFFGFESEEMVATGLGFGAEKGNVLVKSLLESYDNWGEQDYITCPVLQSADMRKYGLKGNNTFQIIEYGKAAILPTEFLCGMSGYFKTKNISNNTYSIHHYSASWIENRKIYCIEDIHKRMLKGGQHD